MEADHNDDIQMEFHEEDDDDESLAEDDELALTHQNDDEVELLD